MDDMLKLNESVQRIEKYYNDKRLTRYEAIEMYLENVFTYIDSDYKRMGYIKSNRLTFMGYDYNPMKYTVIEYTDGDEWLTHFERFDEAYDYASAMFEYLTEKEKLRKGMLLVTNYKVSEYTVDYDIIKEY